MLILFIFKLLFMSDMLPILYSSWYLLNSSLSLSLEAKIEQEVELKPQQSPS